MATSSGTTVIARADMVIVARSMLMLNVWYYERYGEWPTLTQMAQRDSWRGAEMRRQAREYLISNDYLMVDEGDRTVKVTPKAYDWITVPSLSAADEPAYLEIPDETDDHFDVFTFVENFYNRRDTWPSAQALKGAGVKRRIGSERFREVLEELVLSGHLVRIQVRNGGNTNLYTISTRFCPWFRGYDGELYWWPSSRGPLPQD